LKSEIESTSRRIAFSPASDNRKVQFRLDTGICRELKGDYLVKVPSNKESCSFIDVIEKREKSAVDFFKNHITVVRGTKQHEGLLYPFLPYPNLEKLMSDQLAFGDPDGGLSIINQYISLLHSLPTRSGISEDFLRFVGNPLSRIHDNILCFIAGPLDLIPSNILVAENSYYAIDHEWFFDFPIPVDFVIYRGLTSMIFRLQSKIRDNAGKSSVVLFSGYGKKRNYVPLTWAKLLGELKLPLDELNSWNSAFEAQVLLSSPSFRLRFCPQKVGRVYTSFSSKGFPKKISMWDRWQFQAEMVISELKRLL